MKTKYVKPSITVMRWDAYGSICAGSLRSAWGKGEVAGRTDSWQNEGYRQHSFKGDMFVGTIIEDDNGTISSQGKGHSIWDE